MNKKFKNVVFIMMILLTGCTTNKVNEKAAQIVKMDFTKEPQSIWETNLIRDVEILNLNSNDVIFGEISKIVRHGNRIYLMDNSQTNSVIIYDTDGNYINVIDKQGRGPEEYIQLFDMFVNQDDSTLDIISRIDKKMLKYDLDGKKLKCIEKLPKAFGRFEKMKDGYVGYMNNYSEDKKRPFNIWTLSKSLKLMNSFCEINPTWESRDFKNGSVFSFYKNSVYFIVPMDFNIYSINNDSISVPYAFDLGGIALPKELISAEQYDKFMQDINNRNNYIERIHYFQETNNFLVASVLYRGQILLCVYNKRTAKSILTKLDPYIGKYFHSFGKIVWIDEKAIYTLIDASTIKQMAAGKNANNDFESQYSDQVKRLRTKFPDVREDGNPFLIIYSIN